MKKVVVEKKGYYAMFFTSKLSFKKISNWIKRKGLREYVHMRDANAKNSVYYDEHFNEKIKK